jgi:hypothetical protein
MRIVIFTAVSLDNFGMTQSSFDFAQTPNLEAQEIQKWVEKHNHEVISAARAPTAPPGSLLGAIDSADAKANAVYLLRGVLGQILRKSMGAGPSPFKRAFLQTLRAEISVKKTSQDPALILRDILLKAYTTR